MKKLIVNLTIILFLFIVCTAANAVYTDSQSNLGLLHCDNSYTSWWPDTGYWLAIPDDTSSVRSACFPVLNMAVQTYDADESIPVFKTNSPYGGNYLSFDGATSTIKVIENPWLGDPTINLDLSFRWLGLPPAAGDNFAGLVWAYPWKCYFLNAGDNSNGVVRMLLIDENSPTGDIWAESSRLLTSNVWYDLHFRLFENFATVLIVGNPTDGYTTNTGAMSGYLIAESSYPIIIGNDFFGPTRFFHGDIDEIRWGWTIPEPATLGFLSLLGLAFLRKKS